MPVQTRSHAGSSKKTRACRAARQERQKKSRKKTSSLDALPSSSNKHIDTNSRTQRRTRSKVKREREYNAVTEEMNPPATPSRNVQHNRRRAKSKKPSAEESDSKESESSSSSSLTPKKRRLRQRDAQDSTPPSKKNRKSGSKRDSYSPSKALAKQLGRLELEADIDMSDPEIDVDMIHDREKYIGTLRDRLLTGASDFELKCREGEAREVMSFLESHLTSKTCGSLYICGSPGTGKSATVNKLLSVLQEDKRKYGIKSLVTMNAMSLQRPSLIFSCLWELIDGEAVGLDAAITNLEHLFLRSTKMFVVVLDEIDGLLGCRQQAVLYRLFEWCHESINPNSKLILIGVANSIDLTDRFLPKLKHRRCCPELVVFEPYSARQLFQIVQSRLLGRFFSKSKFMQVDDDDHEEEKESEDLPLFDTKALEYCATRVAKRSGDIRKCLELCRMAIDEVLLTDLEMDKIGFQDMASVLQTVFMSRHVEVMRSLPTQQCNVVVIASILVRYRDKYRREEAEKQVKRIERETEDAELAKNRLKKLKMKAQTPSITIAQLERFYKYMAQKFHLARGSLAEFHIIIDSLLAFGLLSRSSSTTAKTRRHVNTLDPNTDLNVVVSFDDVLYAMEEHSIWGHFFEEIGAANDESRFYIPENCRR